MSSKLSEYGICFNMFYGSLNVVNMLKMSLNVKWYVLMLQNFLNVKVHLTC